MDDPVVRVGPPHVQHNGACVPMPDALVLECSEHGELTDWTDASASSANVLRIHARDHAERHHDGLVVAEGWVR